VGHENLEVFYFPKKNSYFGCVHTCNVTYETWHKRLGHIPILVCKSIANKTHLTSIGHSFPCSICHIAKQNRLSFPNPKKFS